MSKFITFEGGEGCGKSTQSKLLFNRLTRECIPAVLTAEPGGTPFGEKAKHLLKWEKNLDLTPNAELLLFNASRAQLVAKVIQPQLKVGKVVICDRFADSTLVYQGYGRGIDIDTIRTINQVATGSTVPDLTILLDISPAAGFSRKKSKKDRFEEQDITFHQRIREGYLKLAAAEPQRWFVVDAALKRSEVTRIIWVKVQQLLNLPDR